MSKWCNKDFSWNEDRYLRDDIGHGIMTAVSNSGAVLIVMPPAPQDNEEAQKLYKKTVRTVERIAAHAALKALIDLPDDYLEEFWEGTKEGVLRGANMSQRIRHGINLMMNKIMMEGVGT